MTAIEGPVIAVSSMVARGTVGLRAIMPAMQARQRDLVAVPTVLLPWHPGHGAGTFVPTDSRAFECLLNDLLSRADDIAPAAILSGWLADEAQVDALAGFVAAVKRTNRETLYLCDPVIGDAGGAYRPKGVIDAIAEKLLPLADIATPNRYELELLTGGNLPDNNALLDAGRSLKLPRLVVTSAFGLMTGAIGNLLISDGRAQLTENRIVPDAPHGPGDLFSALFLARLLEGQSDGKALSAATASVFEMLARSRRAGLDELALATEQACLARPMAMVTDRSLAMPGND
ncbi:PfkB family carbohydrate kinase [Notoacmeibacter sp. MSK16QG-6]|uniref:PfkB family carbohydrate kinase n=1 Tax=Notoacmeibacter sp. MSK16QG-6 TaxID=2957982 RepID=UPI00209F2E40|nr:PfkB family carbohydrate kinase [Notoacmeibacter sp. MSK16QG-6]MCP1199240.1 PfkB family carbohydrate kinase [Notoacmeibacter sp. MSK16QG-6]